MLNSSAEPIESYPELTWVAVIVGWIFGVIIAVSIGYAALILGFSIEGSELAAILGFGILRGVMSEFAAGERYINRVWSSSADGYDHEAQTYIGRAAEQFRNTQKQLGEATS